MKINNQLPLKFGNLSKSKSVISKMTDKNFKKTVDIIYDSFISYGLHKKSHADVILDFDKVKGLVAVILTKNNKTLFRPKYQFAISTKPEDISLFAQRLNHLNNCYAIKSKKGYKDYQKAALTSLKNDVLAKNK